MIKKIIIIFLLLKLIFSVVDPAHSYITLINDRFEITLSSTRTTKQL